jgi:CRP-like cAMP-binding protein
MVLDVSRKKTDLESKMQFLKRVPIFNGLNDESLHRVATITSEKVYSRKSIVFHEGDHGDTLYIIKAGRIKIAKVAIDGREKTCASCNRATSLVKWLFLTISPAPLPLKRLTTMCICLRSVKVILSALSTSILQLLCALCKT